MREVQLMGRSLVTLRRPRAGEEGLGVIAIDLDALPADMRARAGIPEGLTFTVEIDGERLSAIAHTANRLIAKGAS